MQYRKFGKLQWEVSALGFGAMRLPLNSSNYADVDEPQSIRMIRYAIDHGVNYLDTAYPYHSGESERIVGRALQHGYRKKMKLATKLPAHLVESARDFNRYFNEQLERLQTGKIDFYLLHGLTAHTWQKVRDLGVLHWAEGLMADGLIDHLGFSFHDDYEAFKEIVDAYDNWTLCQIQYNYMDVNYQAGTSGLKYASEKGLAVVIMEPLRGGTLCNKPPEQVAKVWQHSSRKRTLAEWALLWVWNLPEVSVVLSGMSAMEQVVENVAVADHSVPGMLTDDDLALIDRVREAWSGLSPVPCTKCGYCMPCPSEVFIPRNFMLYNLHKVFGLTDAARNWYKMMGGELLLGKRASFCTECGECLEKCPQKIDIPERMKDIVKVFGE